MWSLRLRFAGFHHPDLVGVARRERWATDYGKPLVRPIGPDGPTGGSCAEIEVARHLRRAGWDAWWSDGYGQAPVRWRPWIRRAHGWQGQVGSLLREIRRARGDGASGGVPDVVATRDGRVVFVECKGPGDRTSPSQLRWLAAAIALGLTSDGFVLAEFDVVD